MLLLCNALLHISLISNNHNITLARNIDYSATASISKKTTPAKTYRSPSSATIDESYFFQQKPQDNNNYPSTENNCNDCGIDVLGNEPDFSHGPPLSNFTWPVQGKIIKLFNSNGSEGVRISVPFGTAVKCVDAGQVAYAGEQLPGFGKLVIIRHDNGYTTAYAHNSEIIVAKGDRVSRGQIIAKSGQSGNVDSPQILFQLRKGILPVDPVKFIPTRDIHIGRN